MTISRIFVTKEEKSRNGFDKTCNCCCNSAAFTIFLFYFCIQFALYLRPYSDLKLQKKSFSDLETAVKLINMCSDQPSTTVIDYSRYDAKFHITMTPSEIEKSEAVSSALYLITSIVLFAITLMILVRIIGEYCYDYGPTSLREQQITREEFPDKNSET